MTGGLKVLLKFKGTAPKSSEPATAGFTAPLSSDAKSKKRKGRSDDFAGANDAAPAKKQVFPGSTGRTPHLSSSSSQHNTGYRLPVPQAFKFPSSIPPTPLLNSLHAVSTPLSHGDQPALPPKFKFKVPEPSSAHQRGDGQLLLNGLGKHDQPKLKVVKPPGKRQTKRDKPAPRAPRRDAKTKDKAGASDVAIAPEPSIRLTLGGLARETSVGGSMQGLTSAEARKADLTSDISSREAALPALPVQTKRGGAAATGGIDKGDVLKVVDYIQKKDKGGIFKNPVTDDEAPGYSDMIKEPMDFTTMRAKVSSGAYQTWESLESDVELLFNNCMKYNPSTTLYYKEARMLLAVSSKVLELAKQGVHNFRGRTNAIVRQHNQQNALEERAEREAQKVKGLKPVAGRVASLTALQKEEPGSEQKDTPAAALAPRFKNTARPMVKDTDGRRPLMLDENLRTTYRPRVGAPSTGLASVWGGLASGSSCEGQAYASGRPVLKQVANQPPGAYLHSIARFIAGCSDAVRDHVLAGLVDCIAVESVKPKAPQPSPIIATAPTQIALPSSHPLPMQQQHHPHSQSQSQVPAPGASKQDMPPPSALPSSATNLRLPQASNSNRPQPAFHHPQSAPSLTATALQKHLQQQQDQKQQLMLMQQHKQQQDAAQLKQASSIFSALNQHGLQASDSLGPAVYTNLHTTMQSSQSLPSYQPSSSAQYSKGLSQTPNNTYSLQQTQPSHHTSSSRSFDASMHQQPYLGGAQLQQQQQQQQQQQHDPSLHLQHVQRPASQQQQLYSILQQHSQQGHGQSMPPQSLSSAQQQQLYMQQQQQHMAASSSASQALQYMQQHLLPPR